MALLAVSFSAGCSITNPTVRGQAPDGCPPGAGPAVGTTGPAVGATGPILGTAPGYGQFKSAPYLGKHGVHDFKVYSQYRDNNFGYEGGFYAGPNRYLTQANVPYTADGSGCPECQYGQACPTGGCRHCGFGCRPLPHHYQTYQYNWPNNMVYPTTGVPAGIVQYPYYTLRGPTDFFMN
jgi:hypothetical protein